MTDGRAATAADPEETGTWIQVMNGNVRTGSASEREVHGLASSKKGIALGVEWWEYE